MKATEMTTDQLKTAARNYDNVNNEGCRDGYNPYRTELQRRAAAEKPAETNSDKLDRLESKLRKMDTSIARGCGTYDADKINAMKTEIEKLKAEIEKEFWAEWTLEETKARREKWNTEARKPGANETKVTRACGFGRYALKEAIAHYGM